MNSNIMLLAAAAALLPACGPTTPQRLDDQMGMSVDLIKAQQTLNPQASADAREVQALDGNAADAVVKRYRKSFEAPPPATNVFTIGVGSGSSTSSP